MTISDKACEEHDKRVGINNLVVFKMHFNCNNWKTDKGHKVKRKKFLV